MDTFSKRVIKSERRDNNKILLYALALFSIGVIFILSSSSAGLIMSGSKDIAIFAKKQLLYGAISLCIGIFIYKLNTKFIFNNLNLIYYGTIGILILVLIVAKEINGARSWIQIGGFGLQPAEFAKITLILLVANALKNKDVNTLDTYKQICLASLPIMALIILQKDLGTVMIMGAIVVSMMYLSGVKKSVLAGIAGAGLVAILILSILSPYRMARMLIFLDPFQDYYGMGYQIIQSLYSVATGGLFGQGLGNSIHKYGFLPEDHTDFIFAVVTEEVGFVGASLIILLFILLVTQIFKIAFKLKNKQYSLIVAGIACFIAIESLLNLCVVVSLMPVTGVTLPFISYGGSSLISKSICLALILNINKSSGKVDAKQLDQEKYEQTRQRSQARKVTKVKVRKLKDVAINSIAHLSTVGLNNIIKTHRIIKNTVFRNIRNVFSISNKQNKFKTVKRNSFNKTTLKKYNKTTSKTKTNQVKQTKQSKLNKANKLHEAYLESQGFNFDSKNTLKEVNLDKIDIKKYN